MIRRLISKAVLDCTLSFLWLICKTQWSRYHRIVPTNKIIKQFERFNQYFGEFDMHFPVIFLAERNFITDFFGVLLLFYWGCLGAGESWEASGLRSRWMALSELRRRVSGLDKWMSTWPLVLWVWLVVELKPIRPSAPQSSLFYILVYYNPGLNQFTYLHQFHLPPL